MKEKNYEWANNSLKLFGWKLKMSGIKIRIFIVWRHMQYEVVL